MDNSPHGTMKFFKNEVHAQLLERDRLQYHNYKVLFKTYYILIEREKKNSAKNLDLERQIIALDQKHYEVHREGTVRNPHVDESKQLNDLLLKKDKDLRKGQLSINQLQQEKNKADNALQEKDTIITAITKDLQDLQKEVVDCKQLIKDLSVENTTLKKND